MATAEEVALLRKLVNDPVPAAPALPRYSDAELNAALDDAPACPAPTDEYGFPLASATRKADTYGVAATLWEDRALGEEVDGSALTEPAKVTSERSGDVAVSYAGAGKTTGTAVLSPERMRLLAKRLRKRSCNYTAGARTIVVQSASGDERHLVRGGLYEGQVIN